MTNLEAAIAEIEPYSLTDEAVEKSLMDASAHFGAEVPSDDDYESGNRKVVALAAMYCLNRLRVLESENLGGISQSYDTKKLDKRIAAIAKQAGLSPSLVLDDGNGDDSISYMRIW